jgi:cell division septum initiation protein DivIVA
MNDVERLRLRVKELAQRLASGADRAETSALFREVEALQSQAAKDAQEKRYPAPFDMHVQTDRVQVTLIQLARYYGKSSDSRDGTHR